MYLARDFMLRLNLCLDLVAPPQPPSTGVKSGDILFGSRVCHQRRCVIALGRHIGGEFLLYIHRYATADPACDSACVWAGQHRFQPIQAAWRRCVRWCPPCVHPHSGSHVLDGSRSRRISIRMGDSHHPTDECTVAARIHTCLDAALRCYGGGRARCVDAEPGGMPVHVQHVGVKKLLRTFNSANAAGRGQHRAAGQL